MIHEFKLKPLAHHINDHIHDVLKPLVKDKNSQVAELESQLESHKQERYHMTSVVNANTGSIPVLTTKNKSFLNIGWKFKYSY